MTPEQDKMLATAVKYFVETNRVGNSAVVTVSAFAFSKLYACPFSLKEVTAEFTSYARFLTEVNKSIKGSKNSSKSPRHITGIFTREEQRKRTNTKAEARELLQLTAELAAAKDGLIELEEEQLDLETKLKASAAAIEALTSSIAAKSPKPEAKVAVKTEAKVAAKPEAKPEAKVAVKK